MVGSRVSIPLEVELREGDPLEKMKNELKKERMDSLKITANLASNEVRSATALLRFLYFDDRTKIATDSDN